MSIVKVMCDVTTMMLLAHENTINDVIEGLATMKSFRMSRNFPTYFEICKVTSTLRRMIKYGKRGYRFMNYPALLRSPSRAATLNHEEKGQDLIQKQACHTPNVRKKSEMDCS